MHNRKKPPPKNPLNPLNPKNPLTQVVLTSSLAHYSKRDLDFKKKLIECVLRFLPFGSTPTSIRRRGQILTIKPTKIPVPGAVASTPGSFSFFSFFRLCCTNIDPLP